MKKRNIIIDILKGLGIILVVIGHNFSNDTVIFKYIYSFHMPLFFMISGYLYKYNKNTKEFFKKKFDSLMIPYLVFSIISIIFYNMFLNNNIIVLETFIFGNRLGMTQINYNTALWFLPCLFLIENVFNFVIKLIKNKNIILILTIIIAYIGFNIEDNAIYIFTFNQAMYYILFYALGYFIKDNIDLSKIKNNKVIIVSIHFLIIVLNLIFFTKYSNILLYRLPFVSFVLFALSGSALFLLISYLLNKIKFVNNIFAYIGKNSLSILALHTPVREYIIGVIIWAFTHKIYSGFGIILINIIFSLILSIFVGNLIKKYKPEYLNVKNKI